MLRPDKKKANFIETVMSTLLELAEGVEEEELHYRMLISHPYKDDWDNQVQLMNKAALKFRRKYPV